MLYTEQQRVMFFFADQFQIHIITAIIIPLFMT